MDSCLLLSLKLNPCSSPLYPFSPYSYSPLLRLSSYYPRRFSSPFTITAAKKTSQSTPSEFDERINGAFSPGSDSRFLDRATPYSSSS
ncbi:unnamed protein product [Eruca vesicaria subsp. sativa]|uniref:Uncharacterized protein n=1 Tax=Eruca vesicaria subsp. sativa TaxID=29727 RepID=A0ABC8JZW7_ERUVS|nr:unnamed protein product [Eruca vesicaria subsp. sativa]